MQASEALADIDHWELLVTHIALHVLGQFD